MTLSWKTLINYGLGTLITTSGIFFILKKIYLCNSKEICNLCECQNRVKNKVIVITGAKGSFDFKTVLQLAKQGGRLYLLGSNEELGESISNEVSRFSNNQNIHYIYLNSTNLRSIDSTIEEISKFESKVDVLIHGTDIINNNTKLTVDGFEITLQTNFLGPMVLTDKLLDLIIEAKSPRIIFLSSKSVEFISLEKFSKKTSINFSEISHLITSNDFENQYAVSKFALKLYATHLSTIEPDFGFKATSVDLGNIHSNLVKKYIIYLPDFLKWLLPNFLTETCYENSQSVIHACNVKNLTSGSIIKDCQEVRGKPSKLEFTVAREFMIGVNEILEQFT